MSGKTHLPPVARISKLFSDTLGEKIDVKEVAGKASKLPSKDEVTVTFVDADGDPVGVCVLSLALAACLGAALVRMPADAALEAAKERKLSGMLLDTVHEVLNIAAQLLRADDVRHRIVLGELIMPGQPVPDTIAEQLKRPSATLIAEVAIPRYTTGKLTFFAFGG